MPRVLGQSHKHPCRHRMGSRATAACWAASESPAVAIRCATQGLAEFLPSAFLPPPASHQYPHGQVTRESETNAPQGPAPFPSEQTGSSRGGSLRANGLDWHRCAEVQGLATVPSALQKVSTNTHHNK